VNAVPVAEIIRNGFVEGHHYGSVVALATDGTVAWSVGDTDVPVLPRSCNKPVQALGMVRAGLDLPPELLALACASHSGEPFHVDGVRRILAGAGLTEAELQTPPDYPLDDAARESLIREGGERAPVLMNCSGKHAAMLATCVANGWPTDTYREPDHPLQRAIAASRPSTGAVRRCSPRRWSDSHMRSAGWPWRSPSRATRTRTPPAWPTPSGRTRRTCPGRPATSWRC
jgi:L-asparaginase II